MPKCPDCNASLSVDANFCPECGSDLSTGQEDINYCPKCGEELDDEAEFCSNCGEPASPGQQRARKTKPSKKEVTSSKDKTSATEKFVPTTGVIVAVVLAIIGLLVTVYTINKIYSNPSEVLAQIFNTFPIFKRIVPLSIWIGSISNTLILIGALISCFNPGVTGPKIVRNTSWVMIPLAILMPLIIIVSIINKPALSAMERVTYTGPQARELMWWQIYAIIGGVFRWGLLVYLFRASKFKNKYNSH